MFRSMMLQDAHCHIHDSSITTARDMIVALKRYPVSRFFCNATHMGDWEILRTIAEQSVEVVPFFGVHPWRVSPVMDEWIRQLQTYANLPRAGIGEIGLDAVNNKEHFLLQQAVFEQQIVLARRMRKPYIVHCVRAWNELLMLLRNVRVNASDVPFMIHAFSGSVAVLEKLIDAGAYISFSVRVLRNKQRKMIDGIAAVPSARLLLESDRSLCAYNETSPHYAEQLQQLYAYVADIKHIDAEQLQQVVWDNGTVFAH